MRTKHLEFIVVRSFPLLGEHKNLLAMRASIRSIARMTQPFSFTMVFRLITLGKLKFIAPMRVHMVYCDACLV
jgi:hypothetical protein